jgi:hypothetical protein
MMRTLWNSSKKIPPGASITAAFDVKEVHTAKNRRKGTGAERWERKEVQIWVTRWLVLLLSFLELC